MATRGAAQQGGRREGSRWVDRKPEPEELVEWFRTIRLHEGLSHDDYIGGIVLIPGIEKVDEIRGYNNEGRPTIEKRVEHLVFTPYPTVAARRIYFQHWCELNGYLGEIEPMPARQKGLPDDFFIVQMTTVEGRPPTAFVGMRMRVRAYAPDLRAGGKGRPVLLPPPATKLSKLTRNGYQGAVFADENALARAETGAIGRALGFAGMLVMPGSGIATAEDMREFQSGLDPTPPAGSEPSLPPPTGGVAAVPAYGEGSSAGAELSAVVRTLIAQLKSHPEKLEEVEAWAREHGFELASPPTTALRALERQVRQRLESLESPA